MGNNFIGLWQTILTAIIMMGMSCSHAQKNNEISTVPDYVQLRKELNEIYENDQLLRRAFEPVYLQYGKESTQFKSLAKSIHERDSVNLLRVREIIRQYGWVGYDDVGEDANGALFLVIQHSNKETRSEFLPLMREAVKNKKAVPRDLASLEDRSALENGRKQIYGTQLDRLPRTMTFFVLPLEDPDNVDKRRAAMGMEPYAEFLKSVKVEWDVEEYKRSQGSK